MTRPRGDIARAMIESAGTPATVRQVCERAGVGYGAGRYTATRLVQRGDLVVLPDDAESDSAGGPGRPPTRVVAADALSWPEVIGTWEELQRAFWEQPAAVADGA